MDHSSRNFMQVVRDAGLIDGRHFGSGEVETGIIGIQEVLQAMGCNEVTQEKKAQRKNSKGLRTEA